MLVHAGANPSMVGIRFNRVFCVRPGCTLRGASRSLDSKPLANLRLHVLGAVCKARSGRLKPLPHLLSLPAETFVSQSAKAALVVVAVTLVVRELSKQTLGPRQRAGRYGQDEWKQLGMIAEISSGGSFFDHQSVVQWFPSGISKIHCSISVSPEPFRVCLRLVNRHAQYLQEL